MNQDCFDWQPYYLQADEATRCLDLLWQELCWRQQEILIFGKKVMQPRLVAWYGDADARYQYSGLALEPLPWHPVLSDLRTQLEKHCQAPFNSVLANAYRDGSDSMGWHRDDEPELGPRPVIASLSLGQERRFLLRRNGADRSEGLLLTHGSLLVMKGESQRLYRHSLPRSKRPMGLRINLTFRNTDGQARA